MKMPMRYIYRLILFVVLLVFCVACTPRSELSDSIAQTLTPMSQAIVETAAARAANVGGAGNQLTTAIAKATTESSHIYGTQTAAAGLNTVSNMATATAIAPVVAEVPRYGVKPEEGYVGWMHKPVTIDLNGYQQFGYANDYPQVTAADFVLAADIKWFTFNSLSACGFMFRSDGNKNKPNQYMVFITRFATGYLGFAATVNGETSNLRTFYPKQQDKSFTWANNDTNRLVVVARGNLLDIYTNGIFIGSVDTTQPPPDSMPSPPRIDLPAGLDDYQSQVDQYSQTTDLLAVQLATAKRNYDKYHPVFNNGLLGFLGVSQSGQTICTFSNAWLFIINK